MRERVGVEHVWRSEELVIFFHYRGLEDWRIKLSLGRVRLYLLSHLTGVSHVFTACFGGILM